ncbi:hypothetical protein TNCV_559301 [Trichonephila clavipes]|nr:hypothetical protein TNCV_559301 [Trichonephila clavipes]
MIENLYRWLYHVKHPINPEAVVFCNLFSVYADAGRFAYANDGEVRALHIALTQLRILVVQEVITEQSIEPCHLIDPTTMQCHLQKAVDVVIRWCRMRDVWRMEKIASDIQHVNSLGNNLAQTSDQNQNMC